jgi:hypothetical protein
MFGLPSDPCKRGSTIFHNGLVTNLGADGSCKITANLSVTGVTLQIPQLLEGQLSADRTGIRASFDRSGRRASLSFSNPGYAEYNGDIVAIFSKDNYANFSVGTDKCMRVFFYKDQ